MTNTAPPRKPRRINPIGAVTCLSGGLYAVALAIAPRFDEPFRDSLLSGAGMLVFSSAMVWLVDWLLRGTRQAIDQDRAELLGAMKVEAARNRDAITHELGLMREAFGAALDEKGRERYAQAVGDVMTYMDTSEFPVLTDEQIAASNVRHMTRRPRSK